MSRQIKFRAWSPRYSKMYRVANLSYIVDQDYEEPERDIGDLVQSIDVVTYRIDKVGTFESAELVLMQYTGLKDKNGVEIYEGDILGYQDKKYKVIWSHGGFGIINILNELDYASFHILNLNEMQYKVIGNIYSNPELQTPKEEEK